MTLVKNITSSFGNWQKVVMYKMDYLCGTVGILAETKSSYVNSTKLTDVFYPFLP